MAQRGGSVLSHVRIADKVWSPLIKEGEVDVLVAFEKLEAVRWSYYLRSDGVAIINNQATPPLSVSLGTHRYPSDKEIQTTLRQWTNRIYFIDGTRKAEELGDIRTLNIFMLGCISLFAPLKVNIWKNIISQRLPSNIREINLTAFEQGRKEMKGVHIGKA